MFTKATQSIIIFSCGLAIWLPRALVASPLVASPLVAGPLVAGPLVAGPLVAGPLVAGPLVASPREGSEPMVAIHAGCFLMGDPRGYSDDRPRHRVCLEAFRFDRFEVTVAAYGRCVAAGRCSQPISYAPRHLTSRQCNWKRAGRERHPINCVTWDQAVAYCAWLGRRLPTEAEWERAAQGVKILGSPGAAPTCDHAVIALRQGNRLAPGCGTGDTLPIGARPTDRSAAGARDLLGSVSEWTADWFELRYYKRSPVEQPQGPRTGRARVVRGGSFRTPPGSRLLRITARQFSGSWDPTIGFRCAAGKVVVEPSNGGGAP